MLTAASLLAAVGLQIASVDSAHGDAFTFQVHNYDSDGTHGVYLRNSSNVDDVTRDSAHYLLYGTDVELICAESGSSVGSHSNTAWDYVQVLSGPNAGKYGHLSEHWINTPVQSGQHVAGEPACTGGSPTPPTPPAPTPTSSHATQAISWAKGQIGSTAYHNLCLKFVRLAYAAAGDDIRTQVSVPWGTNTYPQDIWGHFTSGQTGGSTSTPPAGALVFYLAKSGHGKEYSHITIADDGSGNTVSSTDTLNKTAVHYESIYQHSRSGAYNSYVGWWLPS